MTEQLVDVLMKQYGLISAAVALGIVNLVAGLFALIRLYLNERLQSQRASDLQDRQNKHAIKLERIKGELETKLADAKRKSETQMERLKSELTQEETVWDARWQMKYDACLEALSTVDAFYSQWLGPVDGTTPVRQQTDTIKARECHNRLALTCEGAEVTEAFLKNMFLNKDARPKEITDNINALRNAIRTELGFGEEIQLSTEAAWFVRLSGDDRISADWDVLSSESAATHAQVLAPEDTDESGR